MDRIEATRATWEPFQLPRIAKPSGTVCGRCGLPRTGEVSTSPDSKAIRNGDRAELEAAAILFQLPRIAKPSGTDQRNCGSVPGPGGFQLPRIAKPSGTWCRGRSWLFNPVRFQLPRIAKPSGTVVARHRRAFFPAVSTSPDSKAIRNPGGPHRKASGAAACFNFPG